MLSFHASFVNELSLLCTLQKVSTHLLHLITELYENLLNSHFILIIFTGLSLPCSSLAFHLSLLEDYCFISSGQLVIL
jgi:hypothetical protein